MLFFYGLGSSDLGTYPMPGVACTHCHTPGAMLVAFFSRYFHFFWIPMFPFRKKAVTVCSHCKQALEEREWPAAYRPLVEAVRPQVRFPLTNFAGLFILGALVVVGALLAWFANSRRPEAATPVTTYLPTNALPAAHYLHRATRG